METYSLCPQDWQRRVSMGNMMQETIANIWTGKILSKFRKIYYKEIDVIILAINVMLTALC